MGWGDCGTDVNGRPIGYLYESTCDHPGCNKKIYRGLSYACGGMHGEDEFSCEKYFCEDHLPWCVLTEDGSYVNICLECYQTLIESGEWVEDEDEGCLVRTVI